MNNLRYFREISGVAPKQIARLINVTVHTYIAFELGRMTISNDVIKMIAKIYNIESNQIFCGRDEISSCTIEVLESLSEFKDDKLSEVLVSNLTDGKMTSIRGREIRMIKSKMK